jgi:putative inorganic carbon (hco3(-)) transporter
MARTANLTDAIFPPSGYEVKMGDRRFRTLRTRLRLNGATRRHTALAYAGLLLFVGIYFGRPEDWVPGLHSVPLAKIAGGIAILSFIVSASRQLKVSAIPQEAFLMLGLFGQLCVAIPFAYYRTGSFEVVTGVFLKVLLVSLVVMLTVNSESRLRKLLLVQTIAMGVMAVFSSWNYIGGRAGGVVEGDFSNPNDFALCLVLAIPFAIMFFLTARGLLGRAIWGAASVVLVYTALITYSRTGFLALLAAAVACCYHYRSILMRRPTLIILCATLGVIVFFASPTGYGRRLATIVHPDQDDTGSAQERRFLLNRSIEVTLEHPLVGVGPGMFESLSGVWRQTHNTYTQLSSEAGLPALFIFLWLLQRAFRDNQEVRRICTRNGSLYLIAGASQASLCAFAVGAFFASVAYHFFPYLLIAYSVALRQIARSTAGYGRRDGDLRAFGKMRLKLPLVGNENIGARKLSRGLIKTV